MEKVKNPKLYIIFIFFLTNSLVAYAQDTAMTYQIFVEKVLKQSPLVRQANLMTRQAQAEILEARGGFDPKTYADFERKYFKSKDYFNIGEVGVKIPTAFYGAEIKTAYTYSSGLFLNPEQTLPTNGQAVVGISLPVWQNFLIDERRANLRKSQENSRFFTNEQKNVLNNIVFDASAAYWKWAYAYRAKEIFENFLEISKKRFTFVLRTYEQGDRTAIDTLESFIAIQDRQFQLQEASLELREMTLKLQNFIVEPIFTTPEGLNTNLNLTNLLIDQEQRIQNISSTHPALLAYNSKVVQLEIEQRLKREKLKPKLNLNYNYLSNGAQFNPFIENYKFGFTFAYSPLLRDEKANVALAKIKIENTQLSREQKRIELENKLRTAFAERNNIEQQIKVYTEMTENYARLLAAENRRFELGESSLFIINSREMKLIESQLKLEKLKAEYQIAQIQIEWASGTLIR